MLRRNKNLSSGYILEYIENSNLNPKHVGCSLFKWLKYGILRGYWDEKSILSSVMILIRHVKGAIRNNGKFKMWINANTCDLQQYSLHPFSGLTRIIILQSGSFLSTYTSINKSPAWET